MTFNIHWVAYPLLGAVLVGGGYLWHESNEKDKVALQAVATARQTQASVDKQSDDATKAALAQAQQNNSTLQKQLASANTQAQQVALINRLADTHLEVQAPQPTPGQKPLVQEAPQVVLPSSELPQVAAAATQCAEDKNQVAADTVQIAAQKDQITARDKTIASQGAAITQLKGGSKLKRFIKDAEYVGIGIGVGYIAAKR